MDCNIPKYNWWRLFHLRSWGGRGENFARTIFRRYLNTYVIFFADPSPHIFSFFVRPPPPPTPAYFSTGPPHIFSDTYQDLKWNSPMRHTEDYSIWDPPPPHIFQDSRLPFLILFSGMPPTDLIFRGTPSPHLIVGFPSARLRISNGTALNLIPNRWFSFSFP